jgi:hypothetical protein
MPLTIIVYNPIDITGFANAVAVYFNTIGIQAITIVVEVLIKFCVVIDIGLGQQTTQRI